MNRLSYETANAIANAWDRSSSLEEAMKMAGIKTNDSRAHRRYRRIAEEILGITLPPHNPDKSPITRRNWPTTADRIEFNGSMLVFSDAHKWPGEYTITTRAMFEIIEDIKPRIIIDNGDTMDGATISRHAPISFEELPTIRDEYEAVLSFYADIKKTAPKETKFYHNIGNHSLRYEAKLAQMVPQISGMPYTTTSELFPGWKHNYGIVVNDEIMIKHRWHCGIHAAYNNVLKSGVSFCTGHTHRLNVIPFTDFRGTRYGIETGTLADPYGPQFSYIEDNPRNWQPGFVVIDFDEYGHHPDTAELIGNKVRFRGKYYG